MLAVFVRGDNVVAGFGDDLLLAPAVESVGYGQHLGAQGNVDCCG